MNDTSYPTLQLLSLAKAKVRRLLQLEISWQVRYCQLRGTPSPRFQATTTACTCCNTLSLPCTYRLLARALLGQHALFVFTSCRNFTTIHNCAQKSLYTAADYNKKRNNHVHSQETKLVSAKYPGDQAWGISNGKTAQGTRGFLENRCKDLANPFSIPKYMY